MLPGTEIFRRIVIMLHFVFSLKSLILLCRRKQKGSSDTGSVRIMISTYWYGTRISSTNRSLYKRTRHLCLTPLFHA